MSSSTSWPLTERIHLPAYPLGTGTGDGQQIKRNAPRVFQVAKTVNTHKPVNAAIWCVIFHTH